MPLRVAKWSPTVNVISICGAARNLALQHAKQSASFLSLYHHHAVVDENLLLT